MSRGRGWWRVALGLLVVLAILVGVSRARRRDWTPATRGERVAEAMGCFTCHGPGGTDAFPNPGSPDGEVPRWDQDYASMYLQREEDIRSWILHGRPGVEAGEVPPDDAVPAPAGVVPMPAYRDRLSTRDLDDLVAFVKAVALYDPEMPPEARHGMDVARRKGCFSCHGPAGRGTPANPGSLKGYVPPFDGADFDELVRDDAELQGWILDGSIPRLMGNPLARYFLDRQLVSMPAYRAHLDGAELAGIIAYIRYLRRPAAPVTAERP